MNYKKLTLKSPEYPEPLRNIHKPPDIFWAGAKLNQILERPAVAMVGTRRMTPYGQQVTEKLAAQLAEQGVVIISGLAYGVDAAAHRAALSAGGICIGVLPSPLDNILPVASRGLASQIIKQGGALISEYPPGTDPAKQYFIARNRLMSGLAKVVLITEAGEGSGAMHTAKFAFEQNRTTLVVPGDITKPTYSGINDLLKTDRAHAVTEYQDVLHELGLKVHKTPAAQVKGRNVPEQKLLDLMLQGITAGEVLLERSGLAVSLFNQTLTMLEITGKIRPLGANHWAIT